MQSTLPIDTSVNSVTSSPSSTHASTKVPKTCKLINRNYKNYPSNHKSHTGEMITVVSDVSAEQSLPTVLDNEVNALPNTDPHLLSVSHLDSPFSDTGFEPTYANTAIPLPVWENRIHCTDYN